MILTKTEFSKKCGVTPQYLNQYIRRDKIEVLSDGRIDTDAPLNEDFMVSRVAKVKHTESSNKSTNQQELNRIKRQREIEKLEVDTRLQELKEQKMKGLMVPTDLAKSILLQQNQSVLTEFHYCIEDVITMFSKKKALNPQEIAEIRGQLVASLNMAMERAAEMTAKSIKAAIEEIAETRSPGERK